MIDPLILINNDMATFIMSSRNAFENWKDNTSQRLNSECVEIIQNEYNSYINQMNINLRSYLMAENMINENFNKLQSL